MNNYISTAALYYPNDQYLAHHGIKGQKWGVRRYQNEDGSYTSAGRKRYGVDLDISDTSRRNIAKIRKGEAYRRLDTARKNNSSDQRVAELRQRVRSAKKVERQAKVYDKGAKLAANGRTISGNYMRAALVAGGTALASHMFARYLGNSVNRLKAQGRLSVDHMAVAGLLMAGGGLALNALSTGYAMKQNVNNNRLRAYYSANGSGRGSKKYFGSSEYEDVKKRRERDK